jgi:hypothetical protein
MDVGASAAQILRAFAASEKERDLFGENTMRGPASSVNGRRQKNYLKISRKKDMLQWLVCKL